MSPEEKNFWEKAYLVAFGVAIRCSIDYAQRATKAADNALIEYQKKFNSDHPYRQNS